MACWRERPDPGTLTLLNPVCFWCWEVPPAWFLAKHLGGGPRGVYAAVTNPFAILAVASTLVFHRGRWEARLVGFRFLFGEPLQ